MDFNMSRMLGCLAMSTLTSWQISGSLFWFCSEETGVGECSTLGSSQVISIGANCNKWVNSGLMCQTGLVSPSRLSLTKSSRIFCSVCLLDICGCLIHDQKSKRMGNVVLSNGNREKKRKSTIISSPVVLTTWQIQLQHAEHQYSVNWSTKKDEEGRKEEENYYIALIKYIRIHFKKSTFV